MYSNVLAGECQSQMCAFCYIKENLSLYKTLFLIHPQLSEEKLTVSAYFFNSDFYCKSVIDDLFLFRSFSIRTVDF